MNQKLVITLPMAGFGTRMRPHTWNKPKSLCRVAGMTTLDYVLRQFEPVHHLFDHVKYVFIVSNQTHHNQIHSHIQKLPREYDINYVYQTIMDGQSKAIKLAEDYLKGPTIIAFADTLIDMDLNILSEDFKTAIAWGVRVNEPEHYGIAQIDGDNSVIRIKEKPQEYIGNMAMVGTYYFPDGEQFISGINRQFERGIHKDAEDPKDHLTKEFYIAPAINILLKEDALPMKIAEAPGMHDAGRTDSIIETNEYLLKKYWGNSQETFIKRFGKDVIIEPPVFIGEDVSLKNVILGPNVSVSNHTTIENAEISHSIIGEHVEISRLRLKNSILGDHVTVHDTKNSLKQLQLSDHSQSIVAQSDKEIIKDKVECHSSATYAERPVSFYWGGEQLEVNAILSRWRTQLGRGFRVRVEDLRQFVLFYDEGLDEWQVDMYSDKG